MEAIGYTGGFFVYIGNQKKGMEETPARLSLKSLAEDDRPREKLLTKGAAALSDAELIGILFGSGSTDETAVELARRVLAKAGNNLALLARFTIADLKAFKGIGEAKAISLMAALELGRRRQSAALPNRDKIRVSSDVYQLMSGTLADLDFEEFWVLYLNRANKVIEKRKISQGGMAGTVTDIRLIMKQALECNSASIVACHNHPSGNNQPSESDNVLTRKLAAAAQTMEIQLLDHIIIAGEKYYSYADAGELK